MLLYRLIKPVMAILLLVLILVLNPIVNAQSTPTTKDSNIKININQTYEVSWESILDNYSGPNQAQAIILHEMPLHGSLNWGQINYPYTLNQTGEAFWYSPNLDFQGADHFKYQLYDGYNYSNISSYNFDILNLHTQNNWVYCPEDIISNEDDQQTTSTNNFGNAGSLNYHNIITNYGTGSGGDSLINQPKTKSPLIRTGGFSL
ncbi:hypothetical protein HC766_02405 [Candidatus Gracilibacteria bacterium]|nr:hypothetical protein [Candidatus Gracilibacteria bacterium]NJS41211.1 hypothetical protein [Candidatus Gracilibacteria bacterium]